MHVLYYVEWKTRLDLSWEGCSDTLLPLATPLLCSIFSPVYCCIYSVIRDCSVVMRSIASVCLSVCIQHNTEQSWYYWPSELRHVSFGSDFCAFARYFLIVVSIFVSRLVFSFFLCFLLVAVCSLPVQSIDWKDSCSWQRIAVRIEGLFMKSPTLVEHGTLVWYFQW